MPCTVKHIDGPVVEVTLFGIARVFQLYIAWRLRRELVARGV